MVKDNYSDLAKMTDTELIEWMERNGPWYGIQGEIFKRYRQSWERLHRCRDELKTRLDKQ